MFPILQVGPLAVQVPGLVLLAGLWLGLSLAEAEANRLAKRLPAGTPLSGDAIYRLALVTLLTGAVAARLAHALRFIDAYLADPLAFISPNPATLAVPEGVVLGLLAGLVFASRRELPSRPTLDALAPLLAVMAVALAGAHLASGDAYGAPTTVPWRWRLWDEWRHPSQVYELLAALGALAVWGAWRRRGGPAWAGQGLLLVAALLAGARLFLEAFRGDSVPVAGGFRAAQVAAFLVLGASLVVWDRWGQTGPEGSAHP